MICRQHTAEEWLAVERDSGLQVSQQTLIDSLAYRHNALVYSYIMTLLMSKGTFKFQENRYMNSCPGVQCPTATWNNIVLRWYLIEFLESNGNSELHLSYICIVSSRVTR